MNKKICPECHSTNIIKNGKPKSWSRNNPTGDRCEYTTQLYRCKECGRQFVDGVKEWLPVSP